MRTCVIVQPSSLFLRSKLGGANVVASQFDTEHPLEVPEDLLVGRGGALLVVLYYRHRGVALCGKVLLRHLRLHLVPAFNDGLADHRAHGLGLDDVVASVDLGQVLAFDLRFLREWRSVYRSGRGREGGFVPYRIAATIFLFCSDDCARTLGGVDGRAAFDDSFAVCLHATAGADFAADAGDAVPLVRQGGGVDQRVCCMWGENAVNSRV